MGCRTVTVKSCIGLISLFFWICAVALIIIGSIILAEYGKIRELAKSTDIVIPSVIVISAGVFLFVIGLLGCIGGLKENKGALSVFFILTLIVLVGEVTAVALGYHYQSQLGDKLTDKMKDMIKRCSNDSNEVDCDELDFVQAKLHCCGADNYTDWYHWRPLNVSIPQSCCRKPNCNMSLPFPSVSIANQTIYTDGCSSTVNKDIRHQFTWIFLGSVIVAVLQTLALVATCILLCRTKETPYSTLDSQGYTI